LQKGIALMGFLKGIALALCLLTSFAAAVDGSVSGTVTDPIGAVIENAPISITNVKTGRKAEIKSGPTGNFGPISMSSGEYKVRIQMHCSKRYSKAVKIKDGTSLEMSIVLYPSHGCTDLKAGRR
jgi:hypothetical protein